MGTMITFRPGYQHGWAWFLMFSIACLSLVYSTTHAISGNETDRLALLAFKAKITADPLGVMSFWNDSTHFCSWFGVTCGKRHRSVTALILESLQLGGTISPHIGNLTFLKYVSLTDNSLIDHIPPAVGYLRRLKELYLYNNSLSGEIPKELGTLSKLQVLAIHYNNLTREIPPSLGNLSSLDKLSAANNNLVGSIPDALGRLKQLTFLGLGANQLSGNVPSSIFNLSSLTVLDIGGNHLHGYLPSDLFLTLPNLNILSVWDNQFSGPIPASLSNASNLGTLYLHSNILTGVVPSLQKLNALQKLRISNNSLGTRGPGDLNFLCSLTNATGLQLLDIGINEFGGSLPECISNLSSKLTHLWLNQNIISGIIPAGIGSLVGLNILRLDNNNFSGTIPEFLGNLSNLSNLDMSGNHLQGVVPSLQKLNALQKLLIWNNSLGTGSPGDLNFLCSLTNATGLQVLDIGFNKFGGSLPECISNLSSKLTELWLNQNKLSGAIPAGIGSLVGLNILRLDYNNFSGTIPESLGNLSNLSTLVMSDNNLQGDIPPSLGKCKTLQLDLGFNNLSGSLPPEVIGLSLVSLSIENNNIYGSLPQSLCNATKLDVLVLSNNHLNGTIPDCLISMSTTLAVLDLTGNSIGGSIPDIFGEGCRLETLKLNGNFLHGKIPISLENCKELKVVDVGNNQLNDTFPCQLNPLSQLQVLILRSNNFRGNVACPGEDSIWPVLQIMDLASNHFSGEITTQFISKWKSMTTGTKELQSKPDLLQYNSSNDWYYVDTVNLTFKGNDFELYKVLKIVTSIDMSNNDFHGEIPREFGNLNALIFLNLSHNSLSGNIPSSFGNLSQLESLDLSCNSLHGNIPQELAKLNYLESLNLSFNKLVGPIPTGKQLQLFDESSYQGNQGLYGPPLTPRTPLAPTHAPGSVPPTRAMSTKLKLGIATGSGIIGAALLVSLIFLLTLRNKKQATAPSYLEFSLPKCPIRIYTEPQMASLQII